MYQATPVHDAAEQGQLETLKILVEYGATIDAVDADGLTPRKLALDRGHHECAQFLALVRTTCQASHVAQPCNFLLDWIDLILTFVAGVVTRSSRWQ